MNSHYNSSLYDFKNTLDKKTMSRNVCMFSIIFAKYLHNAFKTVMQIIMQNTHHQYNWMQKTFTSFKYFYDFMYDLCKTSAI